VGRRSFLCGTPRSRTLMVCGALRGQSLCQNSATVSCRHAPLTLRGFLCAARGGMVTSAQHADATHYFPLLARETKWRCHYFDVPVVTNREYQDGHFHHLAPVSKVEKLQKLFRSGILGACGGAVG